MVEENNDHYYPSVRKTNPIILTDISWWDITYSGLQTLLELTKE